MSDNATAPAVPPQEHFGSKAHELIVATVIAIVLPTVFLGVRLLSRHVMRIRLYFDDWLIIIAWVFKIGLDISGSLLIEHGMGRPIQEVKPSDLAEFLKIQYTGVIQYPLCVTFTKLSILYQYKRLFPNRDFKMMANVIITIMIMWCTAIMFTGIFMCTPIRKAWEPAIDGTCIGLVPFYYGMQIPNVITDVMILLLPFREIQRLELPGRQKIGVAITCFLWVISLAFGVVRLAVMVQLGSKGNDMTWILVAPAIWTTIEPAVQITTACLPSIRVLYRKLADRKRKARATSQRLRSLSLGSRRRGRSRGEAYDGLSSTGGTEQTAGSWTTTTLTAGMGVFKGAAGGVVDTGRDVRV
ncbi:hypothetical protein AUEXF2481DRAFT_566694 [Aureobasidium subglaciale EXF-2481]|uniref:Rhodopsin domain-containing protein n=1 Tax=Aureobasidium subglaciale (strain EXF-2481) TaxID=1043005 RepID=A0A074YUM2_AURSE|nr:uncharacterized protein AUEXF2481DRAFT_566694 [Aureobasidium subglaciale EXF-2481]KEQ90526.1 hypothetical protein AUEXF2481DRAFT_566694 [Aureobasidium subglaciale EXF-2481]